MNRLLPFLLPLAMSGCSLILDFDNVTGLPCPCDPNHVCLVPQDQCFPRRSVDTFKSCDLGAQIPDDLCEEGAICERVENNQGLRCLLTCTPSNYATPESGLTVKNQCPAGTTCWVSERGVGVCSEGECTDTPNSCEPGSECVRFNAAGVCFTECRIFSVSPCLADEMCHPIGESSVNGCVTAGVRQRGEACDDTHMCAATDDRGRPMVCDRPAGSSELDMRRCRVICECLAGAPCDTSYCNTGSPCALSRPEVDRERPGVGLGLCLE